MTTMADWSALSCEIKYFVYWQVGQSALHRQAGVTKSRLVFLLEDGYNMNTWPGIKREVEI